MKRLTVAGVCLLVGCGSRSSPVAPDGGGADTSARSDGATDGMNGDDGDERSATDGMTDGDGPDAGPVVLDPKFAAFCAGARDALVNRLSRCEGWAPPVAKARVNRDPCKWWGAAIVGRRMIFDDQHADACLAQMRVLACGTNVAPDACDRALRGMLKPGETCSMAAQEILSECEGGSICVAGSDPCDGTCRHQAKLAEPCGRDQLCAPDLTCDRRTGTCVLKAREGEACGSFSSVTECGDGLYCPESIETGGPCSPLKMEGEMGCGIDEVCVFGTRCEHVRGTCNTRCRKPSQVGDPCRPGNFDCQFGFLNCGNDMKCQVPPSLGRQCSGLSPEYSLCLEGSCDTLRPGDCTLLKADQNCESPAECGPDVLCAPFPFGTFMVCSKLCTPR